jgi:hypothetical protein
MGSGAEICFRFCCAAFAARPVGQTPDHFLFAGAVAEDTAYSTAALVRSLITFRALIRVLGRRRPIDFGLFQSSAILTAGGRRDATWVGPG